MILFLVLCQASHTTYLRNFVHPFFRPTIKRWHVWKVCWKSEILQENVIKVSRLSFSGRWLHICSFIHKLFVNERRQYMCRTTFLSEHILLEHPPVMPILKSILSWFSLWNSLTHTVWAEYLSRIIYLT